MTARVVLLCVLVLAACKPAVNVEHPSPFDEDDPAAQPEPGPEAEAAVASVAAPPPRRGTRRMSVARDALVATLDQGPGHFLGGVEIKPRHRGGQFAGWEIVQFMPGETRFDDIDVRPGDVLGLINGRHVPRPEHLAALWSELRTASAIVIEVHRGGQVFELRFEITDGAKSPAP